MRGNWKRIDYLLYYGFACEFLILIPLSLIEINELLLYAILSLSMIAYGVISLIRGRFLKWPDAFEGLNGILLSVCTSVIGIYILYVKVI